MTWYEALWFWSFLIVPAFLLLFALGIEEMEWIVGTVPVIWIILLGGGAISVAISTIFTTPTVTKIVETSPISVTLTDLGLSVVSDNNTLITYTDYKDIQTWKDGGKFYKVYYFSKCNFGPDTHNMEVVIKKAEQ